ncbi:MAG: phenylalanine--tRNA ligase subunit beta, partial [Gemmatimonadota bacterium]
GQPLHAFDLDRLTDHTIVVRRARPGETSFTTLDDEERRLGPDMLMICDAAGPVAVAGVMGGLDSEVTEETTDVLLECALFDPASIRGTRRALGISTDASYRFERGVDPSGMVDAVRRAVEIILATAGGELEPEVADCCPRPWTARTVRLRPGRVEHVLGVPFDPEQIAGLLTPLGFEVEGAPGGLLDVTVPGWRDYDVTREVDLIEEVARTWGYDAFPDELGEYRPGTVPDHPLFRLEDGLRDLLVGRGLFESQTPAFVPASDGDVRVLNPVSKEEDHLRRELLPSLVRRVEHNWSRGVRDVRLFELGTAFHGTGEGSAPDEEPRLAAVVTGRSAPVHWSREERAFDIWHLKGLLEDVAARARTDAWLEGGAPAGKGLVPGEGFVVREPGGTVVGWAGRLEDEAVDAPAWADPLFGLEVVLPAEPAEPPTPRHRPLPPFPGVDRDLALLVPRTVPAARVRDAILAAAGDHLEEVVLFDRYVGEGVAAGLRSLAWRMRFQSRERTLTDEDVDRATKRVVDHLRSELGVEPRG